MVKSVKIREIAAWNAYWFVSTSPPHGDLAAAGQEETQRQPTGTLATEEHHAGTSPSINNEHDDNGTSNPNHDGGSNALFKLLEKAADDTDAMRKLDPNWNDLKSMVNIPSPEDENKTPLHLAAQRGFRSVVRKLLDEGAANASAGDEDGWTPLHFACSAGHTAVIDELLSHGADPGLTDSYGENLLHQAISYGQKAAFDMIIEKCPELLNITSKAGETPLHMAILSGNEQMVDVCLKKGAAVNIKDNNGWTPLMMVVRFKDKSGMDKLIQHLKGVESELSPHLDTRDDDRKTPLMVAYERRWSEGVKDLCRAGASHNAFDNRRRTALHYAVESGMMPIIETAIENTDSKLLLKTDVTGNSAFEDFDFNQATHDSIANLFSEHVFSASAPREALEWAAKGSKRGKVFRMLVKRLTPEHTFDGIDVEKLSLCELAVHSRLPWVLWIVIDNFPATSEALAQVEKAHELAKNLPPPETKSKKSKKLIRPEPTRAALSDMQSYLNDFIMAETYRRSLFKPLKPREGLEEVLPRFKATITQFLVGGIEGEAKWIKQSRPVQDVIHHEGPAKIAQETMDRWFTYPQTKDDMKITTQLKWIHLPMIWMEDLLKKILDERVSSRREKNSIASFLRSSWVQVPDRTSDSRSMRPLYVTKQHDEIGMPEKVDRSLTPEAEGVDPCPTPGDDEVANSKTKIKSAQRQDESTLPTMSAAYMPYLSFSKHSKSYITDVPNEREVFYVKLLQAYKDDPLHRSATLDESYYHFGPDEESREDRDDRNRTQVVTGYLEKEIGESDQTLTLIRVKQLWVWTILDEWVITATSHAVDEAQEDDLPRDFLNHPVVQEQITEASSHPKFAARIATLIANYCVDAYERKRTSEEKINDSSSSNSHGGSEKRTRSIRQIFSDTVNDIARKEKRLFQDSHKLTGSQKKDNTDKLETVLTGASNLACDIKDLRDELNILRSIVNSQETVQREMAGNPETSVGITGLYFRKDIEEMENVAKRTQESVDTILSLAETEIANDQARQATKQGRTMMVFTVITIVFLPLSFLSSLFALSDVPFAQTPGWVHVVIFLVSFAIAVPVASIAIFSDVVAKHWEKIWDPIEKRLLDYWDGHLKRRGERKAKRVTSPV
ncbi:ankyrin repeat protein [Fusarium circinatum]|uniref:Ankyrin repeat protein n=1 Tax=Fusarium circinatum TaxID=48490 RepID=A0A8H5XE89_FUSCI|nr:ankyrin repeat protein [Fusarium circinatum]